MPPWFFLLNQALLLAAAGASYVGLFLGRIDDFGGMALPLSPKY